MVGGWGNGRWEKDEDLGEEKEKGSKLYKNGEKGLFAPAHRSFIRLLVNLQGKRNYTF